METHTWKVAHYCNKKEGKKRTQLVGFLSPPCSNLTKTNQESNKNQTCWQGFEPHSDFYCTKDIKQQVSHLYF